MYKIQFYEDSQGNKPARDYIKNLYSKKDKNNRIKANRLRQYIKYLKQLGTYVGEPVVKHIEGDIWELRPAKDRIFFVVYHKGTFVFLHAFTKKTAKTPEKELERARAEYKDLLERGDEALGDEDEYDELEREFFSEEEIRESEFKAILLETLLKAHKNMGISKKRLVELSVEFLDEVKTKQPALV